MVRRLLRITYSSGGISHQLTSCTIQHEEMTGVEYPAPVNSIQYYFASVMAGGFQVPSMMDGGVSFGQYRRSIGINCAFGAGSQLASLALPGESACRYKSTEPSGLVTNLLRALKRVAIERVGHKEVVLVIHRDGPEAVDRRHLVPY